MDQLNLFGEEGQSIYLPYELLEYYPDFFSVEERNLWLTRFITGTPWEQRILKIYNKEILTPRLTAWFGEPGTDYSFSGTKNNPLPWTEELLQIKARVEPIAGVTFNSVLLNYYRDGNDSVAWHSDNEHVLGTRPVIASVSFGQPRKFDIRNKADHSQKYSVTLDSGSFLLMKGDLQENWEHRIPKSTKPMLPRVNLTFRVIH